MGEPTDPVPAEAPLPAPPEPIVPRAQARLGSEPRRAPAPRREAVGSVILRWTVTFAIATAAAGVIDGLWSWSRAAQHLPTVLGRVRWLVYLAASHALAGAVAGAILAGAVLVWSRQTRLGDFVRFAIREHDRRRAIDPGH